MSDHEGIRLQKVLAQAGIASRRAAEIMIDEGRIEVNGELVTEQGRRVDVERDVIRVDGARIPPPRRHVYAVLNKPRGVVSTMDDPEGRPTVADHLGKYSRERLFHVGRLDTDTEGMLLLTNDGDFAQRMMHPSYELTKTYVAEVEGLRRERHPEAARRKGIRLEDGWVNPDQVKLGAIRTEQRTMITLAIHEGRNRIVRRMFDAVGHPVAALARTQIGPVRMGQLRPGELRDLTPRRTRRPAGRRPVVATAGAGPQKASVECRGAEFPQSSRLGRAGLRARADARRLRRFSRTERDADRQRHRDSLRDADRDRQCHPDHPLVQPGRDHGDG